MHAFARPVSYLRFVRPKQDKILVSLKKNDYFVK